MPYPQAVADVSLLLHIVNPTLARMDLMWPCHDGIMRSVLVPAISGKYNVFDSIRTSMPELNKIQLGGSHMWPETKCVSLVVEYCWSILLCSSEEVHWCQEMKLADELTRRGVRMLDQNGRVWVPSVSP